jgi:hypothetical protein
MMTNDFPPDQTAAKQQPTAAKQQHKPADSASPPNPTVDRDRQGQVQTPPLASYLVRQPTT